MGVLASMLWCLFVCFGFLTAVMRFFVFCVAVMWCVAMLCCVFCDAVLCVHVLLLLHGAAAAAAVLLCCAVCAAMLCCVCCDAVLCDHVVQGSDCCDALL